jgi:hypothetical protein
MENRSHVRKREAAGVRGPSPKAFEQLRKIIEAKQAVARLEKSDKKILVLPSAKD